MMSDFNIGRFIVISSCFKPNTAPLNRLLSFLSAFDKAGVKTEMVFVYPDARRSKIQIEYKNINVKYLWENSNVHNRYLRYAKSFWNIRKYVKTLKAKDNVFCFGCVQYLSIILSSPANVYHERTEHPSVVPAFPSFLQNSYLKACSRLKGMFVISNPLKNYFMNIGVKNISVVNMTVDPSRFESIEKQTTPYPYIAYCGTASNNKDGVDDLIKAFSIVYRKHPEYKLVIMGKAPTKGDESGNIDLVEKLGITDAVVFTGMVPASEMPQKLKNAEIVALARPDSLQAQCGFPTKLGEYLLTANPVVVTKVGDIPRFLKHKETALLSDQRDIEAFAVNLLWAINHKEEAQIVGKAGRNVALAEFNNETEASKILKIILG